MSIGLLIIDPQNDFHDIASQDAPEGQSPALAVAGATEDSKRLAAFMGRFQGDIEQAYVTLDTHAEYDIGHPAFWRDENGNHPDPFTPIGSLEIADGRMTPVDPELKDYAYRYAKFLEDQGRFVVIVWPTHCIKGSWGHDVYAPVQSALNDWEQASGRKTFVKEKGKNPLTEHYGAFAAEYPIDSDPETEMDTAFLDQLAQHDVIFVSGQALSHCVGETVRQMVLEWPRELREKIVLLGDTASPVGGFEEFAEGLLSELQEAGVRVINSSEISDLKSLV